MTYQEAETQIKINYDIKGRKYRGKNIDDFAIIPDKIGHTQKLIKQYLKYRNIDLLYKDVDFIVYVLFDLKYPITENEIEFETIENVLSYLDADLW